MAPLQKRPKKDTVNHWHRYRRDVEGYSEPLAPLQMKCRRIREPLAPLQKKCRRIQGTIGTATEDM